MQYLLFRFQYRTSMSKAIIPQCLSMVAPMTLIDKLHSSRRPESIAQQPHQPRQDGTRWKLHRRASRNDLGFVRSKVSKSTKTYASQMLQIVATSPPSRVIQQPIRKSRSKDRRKTMKCVTLNSYISVFNLTIMTLTNPIQERNRQTETLIRKKNQSIVRRTTLHDRMGILIGGSHVDNVRQSSPSINHKDVALALNGDRFPPNLQEKLQRSNVSIDLFDYHESSGTFIFGVHILHGMARWGHLLRARPSTPSQPSSQYKVLPFAVDLPRAEFSSLHITPNNNVIATTYGSGKIQFVITLLFRIVLTVEQVTNARKF